MAEVFVTGGTGYLGRGLIPLLLERGHTVRALTRSASQSKLPPGCAAVLGNALDAASFLDRVAPADTFVQLVGAAHPGPSKAEQFKSIDLVSIRASVAAAVSAGIHHFIYVSVAHPAPVMGRYIAVRCEGESLIRSSQLNATVLRPWYVLGPGHRWPGMLLPVYWMLAWLPQTRDTARRLGLVTLPQMLYALTRAVENPAQGMVVLEVPGIRSASLQPWKRQAGLEF